MNQKRRNREAVGRRRDGAFTLIEMLVVIAVILILAGLIFTATSGAVRRARIIKAQQGAQAVRMAIMGYYNEYGRYPRYCGDGSTALPKQSDVIAVLSGYGLTNGTAGAAYDGGTTCLSGTSANVRKIAFLQVTQKDLDSGGYYLDPWQQPFNIGIDADYNNVITNADLLWIGTASGTTSGSFTPTDKSGTSITVAGGVVVWSNGPNLTSGAGNMNGANGKDDVVSWPY